MALIYMIFNNLYFLIPVFIAHYRQINRQPIKFFQNLTKTYGDLYTIWLFSKPIVIINSYEIAKTAFNKNEFSDRVNPIIESQMQSTIFAGYKSLSPMKFNSECKILRKVSFEAIRYFQF